MKGEIPGPIITIKPVELVQVARPEIQSAICSGNVTGHPIAVDVTLLDLGRRQGEIVVRTNVQDPNY